MRPGDPYHPTTYRPMFLGEFGFVKDPATPDQPARVELLNPQEPLLYWLVPVIPHPERAAPNDYDDLMSKHAGLPFDWSQLR
jgi:hypothetical protein